MKKIRFIIIFLVPIILFESLLHVPFVYEFVLKFSPPVEWSNANKSNNWSDTIVMGSSLVRGAINPKIIKNELSKSGINTEVESIAVPADTFIQDYLTLQRILITCEKCPRRIIIGASDIQTKYRDVYKETQINANIGLNRTKSLYVEKPEINALFQKASFMDRSFGYENIINGAFFRTYYMRSNINQSFFNLIYNFIYKKNAPKEALVQTQVKGDPGYGFSQYDIKIDETSITDKSFNDYDKFLKGYKTGGTGELFLLGFVNLAKKNNIKVYIVVTPLTIAYQNHFKKELSDYQFFLEKFARENNVELINGLNIGSDDYGNFYNINHLNKYGAEKFSKFLSDRLIKTWRE